jgi:hypothetical protein
MKRITILLAALVVTALGLPPAALADQTVATVGGGGVYPPGTTYSGVNVNGLQLAFGAEVNLDGTGLGDFTVVLLGLSLAGVEQNIILEGQVTGGSRNAVNIAVVSGTGTLDLGDGSPPTPGVPFTATLTVDATNQGTIGLVIGLTTLPNAALSPGSVAIRTVTP